jgi:hypothetical protein
MGRSVNCALRSRVNGLHLSRAWNLKAGQHDITSQRILFVRLVIAFLEGESREMLAGQLKTLLTHGPLPDYADVVVVWDIGYFIEYLTPKLDPGTVGFLTALVEAMNDPAKLARLEEFSEWREHVHSLWTRPMLVFLQKTSIEP